MLFDSQLHVCQKMILHVPRNEVLKLSHCLPSLAGLKVRMMISTLDLTKGKENQQFSTIHLLAVQLQR